MRFATPINLLHVYNKPDGLGGNISEFIPAGEIYAHLYHVKNEQISGDNEIAYTNIVKFIAMENIEIGSFIQYNNDIYKISSKIYMTNKYHYACTLEV